MTLYFEGCSIYGIALPRKVDTAEARRSMAPAIVVGAEDAQFPEVAGVYKILDVFITDDQLLLFGAAV